MYASRAIYSLLPQAGYQTSHLLLHDKGPHCHLVEADVMQLPPCLCMSPGWDSFATAIHVAACAGSSSSCMSQSHMLGLRTGIAYPSLHPASDQLRMAQFYHEQAPETGHQQSQAPGHGKWMDSQALCKSMSFFSQGIGCLGLSLCVCSPGILRMSLHLCNPCRHCHLDVTVCSRPGKLVCLCLRLYG